MHTGTNKYSDCVTLASTNCWAYFPTFVGSQFVPILCT